MSSRPRPAVRWALPAGLAAAVVGVSLVAPTIAAAEPDLPDVTAAELLADLRSEPVDGLSGTVVHRADLGLPSLPGVTDGGGGPVGAPADGFSLLDGEHTLRVWAATRDDDGPRARVSLHGGMSELTVVTGGDEIWTWQSEGATATQYLLPQPTAEEKAALRAEVGERKAEAGLPPMTPQEYADRLLEEADGATAITVGDPVTVAGRPAYELVLDPRTDGTLVDEVRIAVDAADRIPTRVRVFAVGHAAPALEVGFTELSLVAPADDLLTFTPPPGATVEVVDLTDRPDRGRLTQEDLGGPVEGGELTAPDADPGHGGSAPGGVEAPDEPAAAPDGDRPVTVIGDGWASVLVATIPPRILVPLTTGGPPPGGSAIDGGATGGEATGDEAAGDGASGAADDGEWSLGWSEHPREGHPGARADDGAVRPDAILEALPEVSGDWGTGRLLTSRLFSVLLTDDGRVLVGAVDGDALVRAADAAAREDADAREDEAAREDAGFREDADAAGSAG